MLRIITISIALAIGYWGGWQMSGRDIEIRIQRAHFDGRKMQQKILGKQIAALQTAVQHLEIAIQQHSDVDKMENQVREALDELRLNKGVTPELIQSLDGEGFN